MGHYDDARQKHEDRLIAESAKLKGMSVVDYVELCTHEDKMKRGSKLYQQRSEENELLHYYLNNNVAETNK